MIHFIRPNWLLLLIPTFLYLVWVIYSHRQHNPWKRVCDAHLLSVLAEAHPRQSRLFFNLTLIVFFNFSIIALAGPAWKKTELPIYREVGSLMLILDLSQAMQAGDIKPNRLERAKLKIRDLINTLKNTQMGLVVFTKEAFVVSPLSQDANTLSATLDELHPQMMPVAGSNMAEGLSQAFILLKQAAAYQSDLLLITASEPTAASWGIAKSIAEAGNHINVLAMLDSNATNQPMISKLRELAIVGGGHFYLFSSTATDLEKNLSHSHNQQIIKDEKIENISLWEDAGPWICLILIPLALFLLREKMQYEKLQ